VTVSVGSVADDSSSSTSHPETAIASAITTAADKFTVNLRGEMPIKERAESRNEDAMDTR
jgi:hypothetical protein